MKTIEETSELLYKALWESKTKEDDVISIILSNDCDHREAIKKYYTAVHPENGGLLEDIKKKLGGDFKDTVFALFLSPVEYDCYEIKRAIKGFSTDEECVYEIISNRPHWMLQEIKVKYKEMYEKELEKDLEKNFSGVIGRNLLILLNTERSKNKNPDHKKCQEDAKVLYNNKEEEWANNETIFTNIFAKSSPEELVLTFRYFFKKTGMNIVKTIETKLSSKLKLFFRELVFCVINPPEIFAEKARKAISGLGTDTNLLERVIITRYMLDMKYIKEYYKDKYNVEIEKDVIGDTSGAYKKLLLALIAQKTS